MTASCPKVLLRFDGKSLLQHHIEILKRAGLTELVIGVGYQHEKITMEIMALGAEKFVRTVCNEDCEDGNIGTLWTLRDELCVGNPVVLMNDNLLYDERIVQRLIVSFHRNCLLLDRSSRLDEGQVKCCIRDGEIIEFRKWLSAEGDFYAETVGMFKLSPQAARKLVSQTELYIEQARRDEPYEEAVRDIVLTSRKGSFGYEDVAGLPWTKIDFAEDLERAAKELVAQLDIQASEESRTERPKTVLKIVR